MDVLKFKDGKIQFRNLGLKELNCFTNTHSLCCVLNMDKKKPPEKKTVHGLRYDTFINQKKNLYFSYFSTKTYIVGTH